MRIDPVTSMIFKIIKKQLHTPLVVGVGVAFILEIF